MLPWAAGICMVIRLIHIHMPISFEACEWCDAEPDAMMALADEYHLDIHPMVIYQPAPGNPFCANSPTVCPEWNTVPLLIAGVTIDVK